MPLRVQCPASIIRRAGRLVPASFVVLAASLSWATEPAAAATVGWRPTPISLVGASTGSACPSATQASGDDAIALIGRLAASRQTTNAAEALLASWLSVPAPVVAVCDPEAAAAGRPIGPIGGTAAVAPWSDGVGVGRRVRGASHITPIGALRPGDRYTLPAVTATAVVDVAVATAHGARTVRAATPAATAPQVVTVEGPASARVVNVTGADGTVARTPVSSPAPLKATIRPATRLTHSRMTLHVKATPGAIIVALRTTAAYDGRRERADNYNAPAVIARATGRSTTVSVPNVGGDSSGGVDVVVLGLSQRELIGVRCGPKATPPRSVSCRRNDTGPMSVWATRHPNWVKQELRGRYDEIVGAATPDLGEGGAVVAQAQEELERLLGDDAVDASAARAAHATRRPAQAPAVRQARRAATATIPASGSAVDQIAGLTGDERTELIDDAVYGAVQAGDANGDLRPDLLVGGEVPRLLMSTPTGHAAVDFDTGGDGGSFGPDLDGDGTTELVDALGVVVLGQRAWATTVPKLVGSASWENGGGGFPWAHDELSGDPTPLPDLSGDGRLELIDVSGNGIDPVYSGADLALGSRTRLPVPLPPVTADLLTAFQADLASRDTLYSLGTITDETTTRHQGGATLRLTTDDATAGSPDLLRGSLLSWQSIDLSGPGGLGPASTPLRIFSRPSLVDVDGPTGDLLLRVALEACTGSEERCVKTVRITRAGVVRATFDVNGYSAATCAFVDDGPDADADAEVVCGVRAGRPLPSRWTDYDRVGLGAIAVASSELGGAVTTKSLPRLTFENRPLEVAGGFATVRTADGRRHVATLGISGQGRKAMARFVIVSRLG